MDFVRKFTEIWQIVNFGFDKGVSNFANGV